MKTTIKILFTLAILSLSINLRADLSGAGGDVISITNIPPATDWIVVPYIAYDTGSKGFGGGAAVLYSFDTHLWAGFRAQSLNGKSSTAAVQAQLQATQQIGGFSETEYVVAAVGMGNTAMYASSGVGAVIDFYHWSTPSLDGSIGITGDIEHYVYGSANGNQINGGPLFHIAWGKSRAPQSVLH